MAFDPKELKRLAKACRDAGIKQYEADGIKFTLTDEAPAPSPYKKRKAAKAPIEDSTEPAQDLDGWESLSEEQKLFYSSRDPLFEGTEESKN